MSVPRLCTAANDNDNAAADTAEQLKKAVESAEMESISTTSDNAAAELERLQAGFAKRLEAMGAAENVPPPPPPKERGAFTISNASANSKAAEEALFRMRRKDNGLLEADNKEAIERAQRAAKSWMDAGLNERAKAELERVQPFCSFKTEVGAPFHLLLAKVLGLCGQNAQARRTLQRIASEAQASTHRWQAEQALERSSSTWQRRRRRAKSRNTRVCFKCRTGTADERCPWRPVMSSPQRLHVERRYTNHAR